MLKFLTAASIALGFCAFEVTAATHQTSHIRVGPAPDERPSNVRGEAPAPTSEKRQKKPADSEPAGSRGKQEQKREPITRRESGQSKPAGGDSPAVASSTDSVPHAASAGPNTTSDGPPKSNPAAKAPVYAPEKRVGMEAGGDGHANDSALTNRTAPASKNTAAAPAPPLTAIYRIGEGDVLDIRLLNLSDARQSTLYTVLAGGILEYPLLPDPLTVTGMTAEELALQLIAELRHRGVYDRPQVRVSVRDYQSHAVLVSGLVNSPGTKILRREAVPLYVVVAEAQPRPEAGRAIVVSHQTGEVTSVDLNDSAAMNLLVQQGDVINLVAPPREFYYVGGEITLPGQKDFHTGMTLTQAVLASGGVTRLAGALVKVSRRGADGRLVPAEYNLKEIEDGLVPDPLLQPGDRIEVSRAKK